MLTLPITLYTAAILGLLLLYLSANVIKYRNSEKLSYGDGSDKNPMMYKAVRAQANFTEYVPLCLILMALLEINSTSTVVMYILSACLLVGRVFHLIGLSMEKNVNAFRFFGTVLTFACLLIGSCAGLYTKFLW